jgi:apoptosis-inducing factor 2
VPYAFRGCDALDADGHYLRTLEIAGEVRELYPDKPITIVQGSDGLLNSTYPKSFRNRLGKTVKAHGITVLTEEYVDDIPEGNVTTTGVTTRSGKHIDADLVVSTRGGQPNTAFLHGSGLSLAPSGHVQIEATLQAKGFSSIFVAGDIMDFDEQKQTMKVGVNSFHLEMMLSDRWLTSVILRTLATRQ